MFKMLQSVCHYCYRLRLYSNTTYLFAAKFRLIRAGLLSDAAALEDLINAKPGKKDEEIEGIASDEAIDESMNGPDAVRAKIDRFVANAFEKAGNVSKKVSKFSHHINPLFYRIH